ncbi:MAG: NAD-binding protein, partial [Erysipelotrichaceae bacterium]|nr:NAD-binding protein [Erysipelotrichaceae bacterium]
MNIIIVGGGKVGFALAAQLDKEGHDVSLIDNNANVLEKASNQLDVVCINGSGAAPDILRAAGVEDTDILIAATSNDEVNIMSCLVAKKLGSSNTIARIRNPEYVPAARLLRDELGLSMSINPERAAAREIVRSIRFSNRVKVSTFLKGRVELAEVIVRENNPLVNQTVQKISSQYKQDILVCAIVRDEQVLIPSGIDRVKEGDRISIIGTTQDVEKFLIATGVSQYREFNEIMIIGGGRITYYLTHMM